MKKILAIDPGTKCGWAKTIFESGTWDLAIARHESAGMRFVRLEKFLEQCLPLNYVFYEEVGFANTTYAAQVYGGIVATIQKFCINNRIQYEGIPVGTIKKFTTGKGNAKKEMMIKAAEKIAGSLVEIIDDNHADAICLLNYVLLNYTIFNKEPELERTRRR